MLDWGAWLWAAVAGPCTTWRVSRGHAFPDQASGYEGDVQHGPWSLVPARTCHRVDDADVLAVVLPVKLGTEAARQAGPEVAGHQHVDILAHIEVKNVAWRAGCGMNAAA